MMAAGRSYGTGALFERTGTSRLYEARRFHDVRHTFGIAVAAAGVAMCTLHEWIGHRNIETTQSYAAEKVEA